MKYFTPDLLARFKSADEDVFAEAHEEWDQAIRRYHRRLAKIKGTLPEGVRRFRAEHLCLHDAQVLRMGRQGDSFIMVLETEPPEQQLVVLTFTVDEEPQIDRSVLPGREDSSFVTWLYEEWDLDRRNRGGFEVLLSNGWSVKLRFRDF